MDNNTRKEMVKARNALEEAIRAFSDLGRNHHTGLRGEMQDDFLNMADDMRRNELRQLVLTAQAMGEPGYDQLNTASNYDVGSRKTVLWYLHNHPDGEVIYTRIATKYPNGEIVLSDDYPAITTQMAIDLIFHHQGGHF